MGSCMGFSVGPHLCVLVQKTAQQRLLVLRNTLAKPRPAWLVNILQDCFKDVSCEFDEFGTLWETNTVSDGAVRHQ